MCVCVYVCVCVCVCVCVHAHAHMCAFVSVSVCLSPRELITCDGMWCDTDPVGLVNKFYGFSHFQLLYVYDTCCR